MFVPVGTEEPTPRRRFPVMTAAIVMLNILVFIYEVSLIITTNEGALNNFITAYGVIPAAVISGQSIQIPFYLTLFTSMFVHAGLAHLGFNMVFLMAFGDNVEDRLGPWNYLIFYLLSGLAATFAHIAVNPTSQIPSVGASGAIAGVLSGYILFFPKGIVRMLLFIGPFITITRIPAMIFIGFWFIIQLIIGIASLGAETAQTGGVAYWAHIGGFAAGFVLALLYKNR